MSSTTNQAPELTVNTGISAAQNEWVTVTSAMLQVSDADTSPEQLVYTITHLPTGGLLQLNGQLLSVDSSFTQDDINQGRLTYFRGNSAESESLGFVFTDGTQEMLYLGHVSNGSSTSFSATGRYVAFEADDSSLVRGDTNQSQDVFVYDLYTKTYSRVSLSSSGIEGDRMSGSPSISADGRYVAFWSYASNLVEGDTNGLEDAFLHDRQTGETIRISLDANGNQLSDATIGTIISADGRYVAVSSRASNLAPGEDVNRHFDVFVYDRLTQQNTRVSVPFNGIADPSFLHFSRWPRMSNDGRYISFFSTATNIVSNDTNNLQDIFVRDHQTGETTRVSVASDGTQNTGQVSPAEISGDGRYVVFSSSDGTLVSGDTNGAIDIFLHDRVTGETSRISMGGQGEQANGNSRLPSISKDGRYVSFVSNATNLVVGSSTSLGNVYIYDRQTGETRVIEGSFIENPARPTLGWSNPAPFLDTDLFDSEVSIDGRAVVFYSSYANVLRDGTNKPSGVYLYSPRFLNGRTVLGGEFTNTAPTLRQEIADTWAVRGSFFQYTIPANAFTDPDGGDFLSYRASLADGRALPTWLQFNAQTLTFSGTSASADVGFINLQITATDTAGAIATDTFALEIASSNAPPAVVTPFKQQTVIEDEFFSMTIADIFRDNDANDFLVYEARLQPTFPLANSLTFDPKTGQISGTLSNTYVGSRYVSVSATDRFGRSASTWIILAVTNVNDAPTLVNAIADQSTTTEIPFLFTVPSTTFQDIDPGDALVYNATLEDGSSLPSWLLFNSTTRSFTGTPASAHVGVLQLKVTASDRSGISISDVFNLTITSNTAPTLDNAIADQSAAEDTQFSFTIPNGTFGNTDVGDVLTYSTTLEDGSPLPTWLNFNATTLTFSGTPTDAHLGTINVRVRATDRTGASVSDVFAVAIANTNDAPALAAPIADQSTLSNTSFNFRIASNTFQDVDLGDTLTYSATQEDGTSLPDWLRFDASTQSFTGTPTITDVGTINLRVTATDLAGASSSDVFTLTILPHNDAPTLANPLLDQVAREDQTFVFEIPRNAFQDANTNDLLTYRATLEDGQSLPPWLSFDASTLTFSGTPTNAHVGTISVRVTATDQAGASISDSFNLVVGNTNDAPALAAPIADQSTLSNTSFNFRIASNTFQDVDLGDTLTHSATQEDGTPLPGWLRFDSSTQSFTGIPTITDAGTINLRVTATDLAGASSSDVFTLTILPHNDAPILAYLLLDQVAGEDQAFVFEMPRDIFWDGNINDLLTYHATLENGQPLPSWLSFDASTLIFSGTPTNDHVGTISIQVTATDQAGASISDSFNLVVGNTNDAPTLAAPIADQSTLSNASFNFRIASNTFRDFDPGDTLTYSATREDRTSLPGWLRFDASTQSFTGTPTITDAGTINLRVTATDLTGESSSDVFTLTILPHNDAPILSHPLLDQAAREDQAFVFEMPRDAFRDANTNDLLTYRATLEDGQSLPSWLSFDASTLTFSGTPTNAHVGTISVRVTATDQAGASISDSFNLVVGSTNDAPTLTAPIADQSTLSNTSFNFRIASNTFQDVDLGDTLTYSATREDGTSLPDWLRFDASTQSFTGTPTITDAGTINLRVTATDLAGASSSDVFTLTVLPHNDAPTLANLLLDQVAREDQAFVFEMPTDAFQDANDLLTYRATLEDGQPLPSWLSFDAATLTFSGTPTNDHVGTISIQVTATDRAGASISDSFNLVVGNTNDAPTLAAPTADQSILSNASFNFRIASNTFQDFDPGDTLTYSATREDGTSLPGWLRFDPSTQSFTGTPTITDAGTINLRVTATDLTGASSSDVFTLTILPHNDAPTLANPLLDQVAREDQAFVFEMPRDAFQDANTNDLLTYRATLEDGQSLPSWLSFDASTLTFSGTPTNAHVSTIRVQVTATDQAGASISDSFDLAVGNTNDAPIAHQDNIRFEQNRNLPIEKSVFLRNDHDVDPGDRLTITDVTRPSKGALMVMGDNAYYVYVPYSTGLDQFTYTITDSDGARATATMRLTVAALASSISGTARAERLNGDHEENAIQGLGDNDALFGWSANDALYGGAGHDSLDGGSGNDILIGGQGQDRLRGGTGADNLMGGAGRDRLAGGSDQDSFHIDVPLGGASDFITDFHPGEDRLLISRTDFHLNHPLGSLAREYFAVGTRALRASDRFIYNPGNGGLFFDADGTGSVAQVEIVRLLNRPTLNASSILVMA
ncbi:putative Ig domain-containing protein [Leptolyngbya sp. FACHB-8]|uniref:putative Ig domain-containing protein n=1 Tax=unclassified Leptolyngbya TaxID=2650499 RepID=UPI001685FF82|nr:putative Ig domain-containing protein [Leptolyngbya sp. FACHB-8]MBD1910428.1 putative Ig domain-containing protein [Leptolyngbya sp. FACHB-8]